MKKNHSALFIFAHPDDESFTSGIAISKYSAETTHQLTLICATRGQAGKAGDPPLCAIDELASFREKELRRAAEILGLHQVEFWDYEDKHLNEVPLQELVDKILEAIAHYQPEIIITFAPHGISGHPDHIAISKATTQAIHMLPEDSSVRKLYYATRATHTTLGAVKPVYSDPIESITTVIEGPSYASNVANALAAHRTQNLSVDRVFPGAIFGDTSRVPVQNHYILAWNNLTGYVLEGKEHDFFSGIPQA